MAWTEERIKLLKKLWMQGRSTVEIGRALGISKNAVVGKVHRLELTARPSPIRTDAKNAPKTTVHREKKQISLMDLKLSSCRWPMGDPKDPGFHFCGAQSIPGKPYCAEHTKIAYTSIKELSQQNVQRKNASGQNEEALTEKAKNITKPETQKSVLVKPTPLDSEKGIQNKKVKSTLKTNVQATVKKALSTLKETAQKQKSVTDTISSLSSRSKGQSKRNNLAVKNNKNTLKKTISSPKKAKK